MGLYLASIFRSLKASWLQFRLKYLACLDNKSCNPAWQTGHILAGFLFPWVGAGLGGLYASVYAGSGHQVLACVLGWSAITTLIGDVGWVVPKEWWWDIRQEHATVSGGLDDALHYWIGSAVSWGIILGMVWALGAS